MQFTPLYPIYQKYQAKVVDFHGWALPVQFSSIIQEHRAVRNQVGLFDISHMGELLLEGPDATAYLERILPNHIANLSPGAIRYSPLCDESGGTVDDLLVYCLGSDRFLLVVNASNITKDFDWLRDHCAADRVSLKNISDNTAQLAIQGPAALTLVNRLVSNPLDSLKYYHFLSDLRVADFTVLISRTGYTGEDGFEIYLPSDQAVALWETLMGTGSDLGIMPAGLGARDTLRFEASLPLYGNELGPDISPLEAGLERFICFDKPDFLSKAALWNQYQAGLKRRLVGMSMLDKGIPRSGFRVLKDNRDIGYVTSGSYAPTLERNLAMALVESGANLPGGTMDISIRGKLAKAQIIPLPFYSRKKKTGYGY